MRKIEVVSTFGPLTIEQDPLHGILLESEAGMGTAELCRKHLGDHRALRREFRVNHKRAYRIYAREGLKPRRKRKTRRVPAGTAQTAVELCFIDKGNSQ